MPKGCGRQPVSMPKELPAGSPSLKAKGRPQAALSRRFRLICENYDVVDDAKYPVTTPWSLRSSVSPAPEPNFIFDTP
jgi:hypothetical protein